MTVVAFFLQILNKVEWIHSQIVLVWKVDLVHPSLNIEFSLLLSEYWLIYIEFNRELRFNIIKFSYPKLTFQ